MPRPTISHREGCKSRIPFPAFERCSADPAGCCPARADVGCQTFLGSCSPYTGVRPNSYARQVDFVQRLSPCARWQAPLHRAAGLRDLPLRDSLWRGRTARPSTSRPFRGAGSPPQSAALSHASRIIAPIPRRAQSGCTKKARIRAASHRGSSSESSRALNASPPYSVFRLLQPPQPTIVPPPSPPRSKCRRRSTACPRRTPPAARHRSVPRVVPRLQAAYGRIDQCSEHRDVFRRRMPDSPGRFTHFGGAGAAAGPAACYGLRRCASHRASV